MNYLLGRTKKGGVRVGKSKKLNVRFLRESNTRPRDNCARLQSLALNHWAKEPVFLNCSWRYSSCIPLLFCSQILWVELRYAYEHIASISVCLCFYCFHCFHFFCLYTPKSICFALGLYMNLSLLIGFLKDSRSSCTNHWCSRVAQTAAVQGRRFASQWVEALLGCICQSRSVLWKLPY